MMMSAMCHNMASRAMRRVILLVGVLTLIHGVEPTMNITFKPIGAAEFTEIDVTIYEDDITKVTFNFTCEDENRYFENTTISFATDVDHIAEINENSTIDISGNCSDVFGSFGLAGVRLGRAYVIATMDGDVISNDYSVIVLRRRTVVDDVFRYGIIVLACILYIGFGCKVRLDTIKLILKKPVAPAIGVLSQFIVMPLVGFALGQAFSLEEALAFGLLVMGCSPGGGSSNVWVNLLDGDLDLSVTMTTISTFISLGMMPLWVFALGRFYLPPETVDIPYLDIFRSLLTIVIPLAVGLIIRRFAPRFADKVAWFTRPWSGIFIVYILGFGTYVNWYMYELMGSQAAQVIPPSILLPMLGYLCGLGIAVLARRNWKETVTISIETGVQNASIPIIILQGSFPQPEGDLAAVMPVATSLFYTIPILIAWLIYVVWKRKSGGHDNDDEAGLHDKTGAANGALDTGPDDSKAITTL